MGESSLRDNPDASPDAPEPRIGRYEVNGTHLYAEIRGTGPPVLLIGANDEDAEVFRPIAERLSGHTVLTYDRRGGLRSGRENWPEGGSARHADDAAELLAALDLTDTVVFGASAGGIVGLQLALRHPGSVRRALIFEPGCFRHVPDGERLLGRAQAAIASHLAARPGDWVGATAALGRAAIKDVPEESRGLFAPPPSKEWYAARTDMAAEALIKGDMPLTEELLDEDLIAASTVDIRFSHGLASLPVFREIAVHLAVLRGGDPDALDGVGHGVYFAPDIVSSYIRAHARH